MTKRLNYTTQEVGQAIVLATIKNMCIIKLDNQLWASPVRAQHKFLARKIPPSFKSFKYRCLPNYWNSYKNVCYFLSHNHWKIADVLTFTRT